MKFLRIFRGNGFPALNKYDANNDVCDNCRKNNNDNFAIIEKEFLVPVVYYIGVYTTCCTNSQYKIKIELTSK